MASTAEEYTTDVTSATVNDENQRCRLLQVLSGSKPTDHSMSHHTTAATRKVNEEDRSEPTKTPETDTVAPTTMQ